MIRIEDIKKAILPLIGWRQSYDSNDIVISEFLTESETGLYYQDAHPLLTYQNLLSVAPDFKNIDYPAYELDKAYKSGTVIKSGDIYYKACQYVPSGTDITDTNYWRETNPFSEWLAVKTEASIVKVISRFINEKLINGTHKALCEKKTLFDGTGRLYDLIPNRKNLVGFEIIPARSKGVTVKINKIGLQFSSIGAYTIIVMHSSRLEPYYVETFFKTAPNTMEWFRPTEDLYLPYESSKNDAGGSWYICYFQSSLPSGSMAIRKDRDWSKGPCNECSRREYETWKIWSKFIEVHPFYVNEEFVEIAAPFNDDFNDDFNKKYYSGTQLWDISSNQYVYDTNFGLNLDITVLCDVTDVLIEQRALFQDCLLKQVAIDFLREFAYNPSVRTNRHSINASRPDILYEIDGDSASMKKSGLSYQLDQAFKALNISMQGIDRICLPCNNHGIKYRTV